LLGDNTFLQPRGGTMNGISRVQGKQDWDGTEAGMGATNRKCLIKVIMSIYIC